ncbi:MAG: thiamine-phosphate pyrophosphorylase [Endomicrobiia bacterium]
MNKKILRIIDANINRITEGLRVIEETLRFVYRFESKYKALREIRHKIPKLFLKFYPSTVFQRNSISDPGISAKEKKYKNINQLLISNFHRVSESLRVLEELSKLVDIKNVLKLKKIRYKIYDLEKEIIKKIFK